MTNGKALITGASSGIGAIYADRLSKRGYDLILVARNAEALNEVAARLRHETRTKVEIRPADLADLKDLLAVEELLRTDPEITMLVNNAGIAGGGPLHSASPDKLQLIIDLNVLAFTRLAAAAASSFYEKGEGTIINIASVTALFAERLDPVYPATKAYGIAFSQALAAQLDPAGVRVQAVLPGATRTAIWERSGGDLDALPSEMVMSADDLVDAALAGLDAGELVTIPSLEEIGDWCRYEEARQALYPNLSKDVPASRYRTLPVPERRRA